MGVNKLRQRKGRKDREFAHAKITEELHHQSPLPAAFDCLHCFTTSLDEVD